MVADYSKSIEHMFNSDYFSNTLIANCNISKVLSKSEMTEVYLVFDELTATQYILKIIRNFSNLIDEATLQSIMKIESEQIVKILDYIIKDNDLYLIKEYVAGDILEDIIAKNRPLIESDLQNIMIQLCDILEYLHTFKYDKLILRDLKPANIIYQKDGKLKLIDIISIRRFKEKITKDTVYIGTAGYAAPEQFGFKQSDVRTDIYNLGATIYYLATKEMPKYRDEKVIPINQLRSDMSASFSKLISKCLEFNPKNRYKTIKSLRKKLIKNNLKRYRNLLSISSILNIAVILLMGISFYHIYNQSTAIEALQLKNASLSKIVMDSTIYKDIEIAQQEWVLVVGDKDDPIFMEMEGIFPKYKRYQCMGIGYIRDEFFWAEAVADVIIFSSNNAYNQYPLEIRKLLDYEAYTEIKSGEFIHIDYYTDSEKLIKLLFVNPK